MAPSSPDNATHGDESKVVARQSIGVMSKIIHLSSFGTVWETSVTHIRDVGNYDLFYQADD